MDSLSKNIFYNSLLMVFNISYPLITMSYVSRILGAESLGIINYSQSIVSFLLIFSFLGINIYGIREIAQIREKKEELEKVFSELNIIKFCSSLIIFFGYIIFLFFKYNLKDSDLIIFLITSFLLLFNIFNLDWFFSGIENYKVITLRNILVKILVFIGILFIVKEKKDINIYCFLLVLGQILGNIWSYFYSKKYVILKLKNLNFKRHFKGLKIFFISSFVISIYTIVNGIILGIFSLPEEVAYFNRARQIQLIGTTITGAVSTVLIPRISYYYKNNQKEYFFLLNKSLDYNYILSLPIMFGFIILSKEINIFLGGDEFLPAANLLIILSPLVVIISIGTWGYYQIIIPMGMEKFGTTIQFIMAITSICLNFALIPFLKSTGAVIGVLISETVGPVISFYLLKKYKNISVKLLTPSFFKYFLSSIMMSFIIYLVKLQRFRNVFTLLLSICLGSAIYFLSLIVLKEKLILEILKNISNTLKIKRG